MAPRKKKQSALPRPDSIGAERAPQRARAEIVELLRARCARLEKTGAMVAMLLDSYRTRYEEYEDPFFAWKAYREARVARRFVKIPDWVLAYLDRDAASIGAIEAATTAEHHDEATGIMYARERRHAPLASFLAAALEMTEDGAGTLLSRKLNRRRDAQLASAVARRAAENGGKGNAAVKYVARTHHTSESTVGNAWRALKATGRWPIS